MCVVTCERFVVIYVTTLEALRNKDNVEGKVILQYDSRYTRLGRNSQSQVEGP